MPYISVLKYEFKSKKHHWRYDTLFSGKHPLNALCLSGQSTFAEAFNMSQTDFGWKTDSQAYTFDRTPAAEMRPRQSRPACLL